MTEKTRVYKRLNCGISTQALLLSCFALAFPFHSPLFLCIPLEVETSNYQKYKAQGISIKARFSTQKILEAVEWHSTESQAETKISEQDGALVRFSQNLSRKVAKACRAVILTAQIFIDNIWEVSSPTLPIWDCFPRAILEPNKSQTCLRKLAKVYQMYLDSTPWGGANNVSFAVYSYPKRQVK